MNSSERFWFGLALKVGLFVLLVVAGLYVFSGILYFSTGYFAAAAMATFAAAAVANAVTLRVFERGKLPMIGLGWLTGSGRNLWLGMAGGFGAASAVLGGALLLRMATLVKDPEQTPSFESLLMVTIFIIFGAVGEEMLFRGYAFQLLAGTLGKFATILPVSLLFAAAHSSNQNVSVIGLVNTAAFGIVLGYAVVRSGDLWMAIGIHTGWNWALPLFGVSLSGFKIGLTGYAMRWNVGDIWSGGGYGPEGSVLTCAVVVALFWFVMKAPAVEQRLALVDGGATEEA
jgi:membrane protease YdiL (CAAX protease family)